MDEKEVEECESVGEYEVVKLKGESEYRIRWRIPKCCGEGWDEWPESMSKEEALKLARKMEDEDALERDE